MTVATYKLEVDWNDNDLFDGGNEDITARLLHVEFSRGRDFASQLTGRASGGLLIATLNNESGDYSSFNTSSPIFLDILPGRKVRLQATDATGTVTLWQGFLNRISPQPDVKGANTALLEAVGPLTFINQKKVQLAKQASSLTGTLVGAVLDEVGWPSGDRDIDAGQSTIDNFIPEDDTKALQVLRELEETEKGFLHESRDGKIIFEDRNRRINSPHTISQATFSDATAAARSYSRVVQADPLPELFNHFEARVQTFSIAGLGVLWTLSFIGVNSPSIAAQTTRTWIATPTEVVPVTVQVDAWTTPVANTDYTANSQADGGGTDLTSDIVITVTKLGFRMKIDVKNNHASTTAFITKLQARGTAVTRDDPVIVAVDDTSSQAKFGERSFAFVSNWLKDVVDALAHLNYLAQVYAFPKPILSITIQGNRDANHLSEVLRRDISDRVTIVGSNDAGLGINEDFFFEGEAHIIDAHQMHQVTYECASIGAFGQAWRLGTSKLNIDTQLFF